MKDKHAALTDEIAEMIVLRALAPGEGAETERWERHLAGCGLCRSEFDQVREALATLPLSLPEARPSAELRMRLLERVRQSDATTAPPDALRLMDFEALVWEPSESGGVSFHWLRRDPDSGAIVALARLRQGCSFPRHSRKGGEDCFVLQGGFREGDSEYRAGQLVYFKAGAEHRGFEVLPGPDCILLVVSHGRVAPRRKPPRAG